MDQRTLKALLQAEKADALGPTQSSKLSRDRQKAMEYYMGDVSADMPTMDGRSTAVSTDVSDTIEGLLPSLMDIFCGTDDVVRFDPVGPEDVDAAQQETDYVNYVFMQLNPGFMILYSMFKDAMLSKTGVAKVWWDKKETDDRDTYFDQPDDVWVLVSSDPEMEVIEHTEREGPPMMDYDTGEMEPQKLHDFKVKTTVDESQCCIEPVPPEEFGISRHARLDVQNAHYMYHETTNRTQADLIADGYDKHMVEKLPSFAGPPGSSSSMEESVRDTVDESSDPGGDESMNKAMRRIRVTEHYIKMDYDGDGVARRYMVVTGGEDGDILTRKGEPVVEELDWWPFAAVTPIPQTHRFIGRSIADIVMDIQRINTSLTRALLDNAYLANNVRMEVPEQACSAETFDDIMNSRPGGIIRTKNPGMLREVVHPDIGDHVYPALQYFDAKREWRTGVSRQGQGLDADALNNQTATAAMQLYNASQARMKLVAKIFAETGVADLFWLVHSTIRKYGDKPATVKLRNTWVTVDPRNWKSRKDMTVDVGLGRGGKAEETTAIMGLISLQKAALEGGLDMLCGPKELFNSAADYCKVIGKKDVTRYFIDPGDDAEMPEPAPDPAIVKAQMDAQSKQQELQMKAQLDTQAMTMKAEIEKVQAQADIATQQLKTQSEMQLAEKKFELERELKIIEAQLKVHEHEVNIEAQKQKASVDVQMMGAKHELDVKSRDQDHKLKQEEIDAKSGTTHKDQLSKLEKLIRAPRKTVIERDPKTKKATGAVSKIVED